MTEPREAIPKALAARMLEDSNFFKLLAEYVEHAERLRKDDLARDQDEVSTVKLRGELEALRRLRYLRETAEGKKPFDRIS